MWTRREFFLKGSVLTVAAIFGKTLFDPRVILEPTPGLTGRLPDGLSFAGDRTPDDPTHAPDTILLRVSAAPDTIVRFASAAHQKVTAAHGIWLGVEDPRHLFRTFTSESARQATDGTISFTLAVSAASNEARALGTQHPDPAFSAALKKATQQRSNELIKATQALAVKFGNTAGEHQVALASLDAYARGKSLVSGEIKPVGALLAADYAEARSVMQNVDPKHFIVWLHNMDQASRDEIAKRHLGTLKGGPTNQTPYLTLMELFSDTHQAGLTMAHRAEIIRQLLDEDQTKLRAGKLICSLEDNQRRELFDLLDADSITKITSSLYQPITKDQALRLSREVVTSKIKNEADRLLLKRALEAGPDDLLAIQAARVAISGRMSQQFTSDERQILISALASDTAIAAGGGGFERKLVAQQWAVDLLDYSAGSTPRMIKIQTALVGMMNTTLDITGDQAKQRLNQAQLFWQSVFLGASGLDEAQRAQITQAARDLLYSAIATAIRANGRGDRPVENLRLAIGLYTSGSPPVKPREEAELFSNGKLLAVDAFLQRLNEALANPKVAAEVFRQWYKVQEETASNENPVAVFDQFLAHYNRWAGTASDYRRANDFIFGRENIFGGLALFLIDSDPKVRASIMKTILEKYPHLAGALAHAGLSGEAIAEILPTLSEQNKKKWLTGLLLAAGLYYGSRKNNFLSTNNDRLLQEFSQIVPFSSSYATALVSTMDPKSIDRALSSYGGWQSASGDNLPVEAVASRGRRPPEKDKRSLGYLLAEILPDAMAKRRNSLPFRLGIGKTPFDLQMVGADGKTTDDQSFSIWSILNRNFPLGYPFEITGIDPNAQFLILLTEAGQSEQFVRLYVDGKKLSGLIGRNSGTDLLDKIKAHLKKGGKFALVGNLQAADAWLQTDPALRENPPFELMLVKSLMESSRLYVRDGVEYTVEGVLYEPTTKQFIVTTKDKPRSEKKKVPLGQFYRFWQIK